MGGIQKSDQTDNTAGSDEEMSKVSRSYSNTSKRRKNANDIDVKVIGLAISKKKDVPDQGFLDSKNRSEGNKSSHYQNQSDTTLAIDASQSQVSDEALPRSGSKSETGKIFITLGTNLPNRPIFEVQKVTRQAENEKTLFNNN